MKLAQVQDMSSIKKNSVTATSGKNKIKFDIKQQGFAWIADKKIEKKWLN
jgi:hypothetical protein